jgi:hypothetical protein
VNARPTAPFGRGSERIGAATVRERLASLRSESFAAGQNGPETAIAKPQGKIHLMSEAENQPQPEEEFHIPLPPASFSFLVLSLRAQTEMQLGLMPYGEEEHPKPELDLARHSIDMMGVLSEKTKGNLSIEEQRLLENSLTELRFRFVQVSEEVAKAAAQAKA